MSNLFPYLPGITYSRTLTPNPGVTIISQSTSGKEVPYALRSATTIWSFEFTYSVLRAARGIGTPMFGRYAQANQVPNVNRLYNAATLTENEAAVLMGFFANLQGSYGRFLLDYPRDNTAGLYKYATADGKTTQWQTPIQPFTPSLYIDQSPYGAQAVNSFAADANASITGAGLVTRTTVAAIGQPLYLSSPQASAASAYPGEKFGTGDGATTAFQLTRTIGGTATGYAEPIQNLNGSPTIYINGTKKSSPADYSVGSTGIVTFTVAPANNAVLSWEGKFYFLCRFSDDSLSFEEFMHQFYSADSVKVVSLLQ